MLEANLETHEDQYLAWDLCFLAMSFHRLGEADRAHEFRAWALRWSREEEQLSVEHRHELSSLRDEMEAILREEPATGSLPQPRTGKQSGSQ